MLFLGLLLFIISCKQSSNSFELVFLVTTDIHGSFFPFDSIRNEEVDYSLAHASYILDELRNRSNTEVIYIDSGDYLQGDPVVDYFNQNTTNTNVASSIINSVPPITTIKNNRINLRISHCKVEIFFRREIVINKRYIHLIYDI